MLILAGCESKTEQTSNNQIANPASVFCEQKGGSLAIVDGEGGQQGICTLSDGRKCEEWAYYRGTCPAAGCGECPQLVPPGPTFCPEGTIVAGDINDCGCQGPPKCT